MKVQTGNRKFIAFILILCAFVIISLAVLVSIIWVKGALDINSFSGLFVPLGTGLMLIGGFFFASNAAVHFSSTKDKESELK